jgi:glyoxylase-like metal-dependent hydrolase (beta-lactamase superfamily II)
MMNAMTKTRRLKQLLLTLVASGIAAGPAFAAQSIYDLIENSAATSPIKVTPLRGHATELDGSGGNIGVLTSAGGAFLVDGGISVSKSRIEDALRKLGASKVKYVVNTHWHWDHADGNAWLHAAGATIIASPETAKHLGETIPMKDWGHVFTPAPKESRPTILVSSPKTMMIGDETVEIQPYMHSHTDGDLMVRFKKANVIFTGDIFWNSLFPYIDNGEHGSIDGTIKATEWTIQQAGPDTIIVPGHGPVGNRAALIAYRDMLVAVRDKVTKMKNQGLTLDQIIAAHPTAPYDAKWSGGPVKGSLFTTLVYRGL